MVCGKEKERDDHAGESDGIADLHDALRLVVRSQEFIVEETVEKVADEYLELSLFAHWSRGLSLDP